MNSNSSDTLLGIDFGETNVGLAFGRNELVSPLKVMNGKSEITLINELNRLAIENSVAKFIVGLPLTVEGKETNKSLKVRKFAKLLKIYSRKPVEFQNEYGTTIEAQRKSIELGLSKKRREAKDHLAAAILLRRYYDENPRAQVVK